MPWIRSDQSVGVDLRHGQRGVDAVELAVAVMYGVRPLTSRLNADWSGAALSAAAGSRIESRDRTPAPATTRAEPIPTVAMAPVASVATKNARRSNPGGAEFSVGVLAVPGMIPASPRPRT